MTMNGRGRRAAVWRAEAADPSGAAFNKGGGPINLPPWEGFDFKTDPYWVVVGSQGGVNAIGVDITPLAYDECITKTPDNYSIAGVNPASGDGAFNVVGYTQGHTAIRARWGHETFSPIISNGGTLNVCVKNQRTIRLDFHIMSDYAEQYQSSVTSNDIFDYVGQVNAVWTPQTNIVFEVRQITHDTMPAPLGAFVDCWPDENPLNEWDDVIAVNTNPSHFNIYFVWRFKNDGVEEHGLARGIQYSMISDATSQEPQVLAHELGHMAGLPQTEQPDGDELMGTATGTFINHDEVEWAHYWLGLVY